MKPRHKISFAAAVVFAAAVSLVSCVKDDLGEAGNSGGGLKSDREMFLSFTTGIEEVSAATRANGDAVVGLSEENWVSNVRMVLYEGKRTQDAHGNDIPDPEAEVLYAFDYCISSKSDGGSVIEGYEPYSDWDDDAWQSNDYGKDEQLAPYPGSPIDSENSPARFVTYARGVQDRDYHMLILINMPTYDPGANVRSGDIPLANLRMRTEPGMKLKDFQQATPMSRETLYLGRNTLIGHNYFFMCNANGLIFVPSTDLGDSKAAAHANPIATEVERAVAKILVTKNDDIVSAPAQVGSMRFDLVNTNKWFYWMRKQTFLIEPAGNSGNDGSGGLHELGATQPIPWATRPRVYAEDPNFTGYIGQPSSQQAQQFDQITELYPDGYDSGLFFGRWVVYEKNEQDVEYAYTLENTMTADDHDGDLIPSVYLSVTYSPDAAALPLVEDKEANYANPSYFVFNKVVLTIAQMQEYAQNPENITDPELDGLADAIQDLENDTSLGITIAGITNDSPPFRAYGINFYQYAVNYYKVPVLNYVFADGVARPAYGEYGVVRNGMYHVNITKIEGPGSPVLTDPAFISAEVNIVKWAQHMQGNNLGKEVGDLNKKPSVEYRYYYDYWGYGENSVVPYAALDDDNNNQGVLGWHIALLRSYFKRQDVGDNITVDPQDLNRFKYMLATPETYADGVAYGIFNNSHFYGDPPEIVSANNDENIVHVYYEQDKGEVEVRFFEYGTNKPINSPNGYTTITETLPAGMEVNNDTRLPSNLGETLANTEPHDYDSDYNPNYYSFHSMNPASVTITSGGQHVLDVYYTLKPQVRVICTYMDGTEIAYSRSVHSFTAGTVVTAESKNQDGYPIRLEWIIDYYNNNTTCYYYDCVPAGGVVAADGEIKDLTFRYVALPAGEGGVAFVYCDADTGEQFSGDQYNQVVTYTAGTIVRYDDTNAPFDPTSSLLVGADNYNFSSADVENVEVVAEKIKVIRLYYSK